MIQRLVTHAVLWAMLTGIFTPLASAAAQPHACCLRHQQRCHMPDESGVSTRNCGHECCRLLAISTALFAPLVNTEQETLSATLLVAVGSPVSRPFHLPAQHSGRAPPTVS